MVSRKTHPAAALGNPDPSYRQRLLDAIGQFICWRRLPQVAGRNARVVRWTAPLLVMVALLMALDGAQHLSDRFEDARRAVRGMWPHGWPPGKATRVSSRDWPSFTSGCSPACA